MKLNIIKTKNTEQLYIAKSYRNKNGKSTSKIFKKLGTVESLLPLHNNSRDEVIAWAKELTKMYTQKEKEDDIEILLKLSSSTQIKLDHNSTFNAGYLFLQNLFHELQLDKICDDIKGNYRFDYNLTDILSKIIYSRILSPSSKLSTYEYSKKFIDQPDFDIHQMYRALDVLAKESESIQASLYKNSTKVIERNTSVLYYDCTNFFFEEQEADGLKQYGKSKENRPNPIVQMGLFLDGNGIPLSFVIFPGNESEQPSLIPLEKKIIKDFDLSKFIVCTDAGLASTENRKFNNKGNRSYIVTQSLKKTKAYIKSWALNCEGWRLPNDEKLYNIEKIDEQKCFDQVFYKERWLNENDLEQRLIVSFSPKYRAYQRSVRQGQIDRAEKMVNSKKKVSHKNPNSASRFVIETKTTPNGEIAKESYYSIDDKAILNEMKYDGFYGVCTTLEDSVQDIIRINKNRWEIEETFRIMKTDFKSRPIYLKNDERIKAHFLTCFISLMIYRTLEKKLDEKYTSSQLLKTLREMNLQYYEGYGYLPAYTRTKITDDLHEVFGFRTDTQIVTTQKMKKIIKLTKN